MRVTNRDGLIALPAGTIYSNVEDGYAHTLHRKGDTDTDTATAGDGWWCVELLPQRTGGAEVPYRQRGHWCPRDGYEVDEEIFVYDAADVETLIAGIRGAG